MKLSEILLLMLLVYCPNSYAQREVKELDLWKFYKGDTISASQTDFDDSDWESVTIPHDWAIYGPFDMEIDKQVVKIEQNNEKEATEKTGRTGALPFVGAGWYRTILDLPQFNNTKQVLLTFDGAMSNAEVFVNGIKVGNRPYGYSYFYFDISDYIKEGKQNVVAVRLENQPFSSRWYPGAGLYRKVRIVVKNKVSFKHWGHFITTPFISKSLAKVNIRSQVQGENLRIVTKIKNADGKVVVENMADERFADEIEQNIAVKKPNLWSPESPYLYTAEVNLYQGNVLKDTEIVRFGIREIKYTASKGFELNGRKTKLKGVCLHHDLGPIGVAINRAALKRQLTILKDLAVMPFAHPIICLP